MAYRQPCLEGLVCSKAGQLSQTHEQSKQLRSERCQSVIVLKPLHTAVALKRTLDKALDCCLQLAIDLGLREIH